MIAKDPISKNQIKHIRALGQKKQRTQLGQFLVQGEKNVRELLDSNLTVVNVFATQSFIQEFESQYPKVHFVQADENTLAKASTLVSNNAAIAVVNIPQFDVADPKRDTGLILALDGVSDPGNLGTIIRLADWFGVNKLLLSEDCADPFNPKTISATMGSFSRVHAEKLNLAHYLESSELPVFGAYLGGESVHSAGFRSDMILVMGSESHGIRPQLESLINNKITIEGFGQAESLNVAMAAGIILDNVRRIIS